MVYSYYRNLTGNQRRAYRESDRVAAVRIPSGDRWAVLTRSIERALKTEETGRTGAAAQELVTALTRSLGIRPVRVRVLDRRPSRSWGELHGLYEPGDDRTPPRITVWMRTAQRRQVVAFRTFLRTVVHEAGHHLDYELLRLSESFHTEGFYKRESSLLKQLLSEEGRARA